MKYHYIGLTGHINGILKQLDEQNIPWEYAERSDEFIINAFKCDLAYVRQNENDINIIDSEKLNPGKFTTELYEKWGEQILQKHRETATDTDLIYGLEGTLEDLKLLKTVNTKQEYDFIYNSIIKNIEEDIQILRLRKRNNNNIT